LKLRVLTVVFAALAAVALASEDAPPEHQKWMKDLGSQQGAMRKGVDVEKNAKDMQDTLKLVNAWWENRKLDDAVKSTNDSAAGAEQVAKAAQAGDAAGIGAGMKMIGAGCKSCHDAHREKISDTVYKIK
jgi:cytochrome c556